MNFIGAATGAVVEAVPAEVFADGLGASQTVHFDFAVSGFWRLHVAQVQVSAAFFGGAMPAATQLKPPDGVEDASGTFAVVVVVEERGESQMVHFDFADSGF